MSHQRICGILLFALAPALYSQAPQISADGVVNAASFTAGAPIAPGSIATLFGTNLGSSASTTVVRVNGIPATSFVVVPTQINFQVPWEAGGQSQASITVTTGGVTSNSIIVPIAPVSPGIFALDTAAQGAVVIAGTATIASAANKYLGSRPAQLGEYITIYCTGLGPVSNQPSTGQQASATDLSETRTMPVVTIGGVQMEVLFSGLTPGFLGLYQVNARVPEHLRPNFGTDPNRRNDVSGPTFLSISVGGRSSNRVNVDVQNSPASPFAIPSSVEGPPGGVVESLFLSADMTKIYAGLQGRGLMRSSVDTATWRGGFPGITAAFASDPSNPNIVYAGSYGMGQTGIFKSLDAGSTWMRLDARGVFGLAIDPFNPAILYALPTTGGVLKSTDAGSTWAAASTGLPTGASADSAVSIAVDPSNGANVYVLYANTGVYKSTNSGRQWALSGMWRNSVNATLGFGLVFDPSDPKVLYAAAGNLQRTLDGGQTWTIVPYSGRVTAVAVDPRNPTVLYVVGNRLIRRSTDRGATWTDISRELRIHSDTTSVVVDRTGSVYVGTLGDGVFVSSNAGQSWREFRAGMPAWTGALAVDPTDPDLVYLLTNQSLLWKSRDGGRTWSTLNSGLPMNATAGLHVDPKRPSNLYIWGTGFEGTGLFKSVDSGEHWTSINGDLNFRFVNINAFAIDPVDSQILYMAGGFSGGSLRKSVDGGQTWRVIGAGSLPPSQAVSGLVLYPPSGSVAGLMYASVFREGVFRSSDGGETWIRTNSTATASCNLQLMSGDPSTRTLLYARNGGSVSCSGGVYRSLDGGITWLHILQYGYVGGIVKLTIDPTNHSTLYVSAGRFSPNEATEAIYKSTDTGTTWRVVDSGTTAVDLAVSSRSGTVYSSTGAHGFRKSLDAGLTWVPANAR